MPTPQFATPSTTRRGLLLLSAAALAGASGGCNSPVPVANGVGRLKLLAETRIAHRTVFSETIVGGLSGIDYDDAKGEYLLVSDDRSDLSPARFYGLRWTPGASVAFSQVTSLRQGDGSFWAPRRQLRDGVPAPDPEALRWRSDTGTILWTSEGDVARGFGPALYESRRDGSLLRQFALAAMFEPSLDGRRGARDNLGFEGLALTPDQRSAWVAMEGALVQDGGVPSFTAPGGPCRFTQVDLASGRPSRQIAYLPDPIRLRPLLPGAFADNGVTEILMLDAHRMLVIERAYATGAGNALRLYEIDTRSGSDTLALDTLTPGNHRAAAKTLVADFSTLGLSQLDNTEGMCWGPPLPNGHRMLVVVSDDNFNPLQITQLAAFDYTDRQ